MRTINKILITTAVVLIPIGVFAENKLNNDKNYSFDLKKEYSEGKHDKNTKGKFKKYLMKRGVNYSFEGKLISKPMDGFNGLWVIDDIEVLVDDKTYIKQESKEIKIGDEIEIKAKRESNKITAIVLEQENSFFN